jgi:ubiquinone/menaquinone biosynthesis C-methylase UbiE
MADAPTFDPEAFRIFEHQGWNRLSLGYHSHWENLTTQAIPQMLDSAGVAEGKDVLDVACGPGYVSGAAAARGAKTVGVDLSENMTELAAKNYPNLPFEIGDAEALRFQEQSFDVVLINFGILHFPDADKALSEAYRVLRLGGRLGFTAWAGPEGSAIGIAMEAVAKEGTLEVDLPAGTPMFRFADHSECERALRTIGFNDISSRNLMLTWRLPRPDALMESFRNATVRAGGLLDAQDPAVRPAIAAAMTQACKPYNKGGYTDLPMPAVLTVGAKT